MKKQSHRKNNLLLQDFAPVSMLAVQEHLVRQAKFPVVDMHNHINDASSPENQDWHWEMEPSKLVKMMDRLNVRTIVILTGGWGDKLQSILDKMVKPYPKRFIVYTEPDYSRAAEPDFGKQTAWQVRDSVRRGARGFKVLKELGLVCRDRAGRLIKVDSPQWDPIWEECASLGIPVSIHSGDPAAFFKPLDKFNERYDELVANPSWHFYGKDYPSLKQVLDAQFRLFKKHRETNFVAVHMAYPENLDYAENLLDRCPNVMMDFAARAAELGRQPNRARKLFLDYSDRILFGIDNRPGDGVYQNYFRWLETADDYFEPTGYPGQGRWKIYGLNLPDPVLKRIYHKNADRLFARFKGL